MSSLQTDVSQEVWPAGAEPGTFYPDGAHTQRNRAPSFETLGNMPEAGRHGAIGLWSKRRERSGDAICVSSSRVAPDAAGVPESLAWGIGFQGAMGGLIAECAPGRDSGAGAGAYWERVYYTDLASGIRRPGLEWRFIMGMWDTDGPKWEDVYFQWTGPAGTLTAGWDTYAEPYDPTLSEPAADAATSLVVGCAWPGYLGAGLLGHLVDEVAICDFGDDWGPAFASSRAWADLRYRDGRYYKGNDGTFLSPPIAPAGGAPVRLRDARWTAFLPAHPRAGIPLGSPIPAAGIPRAVDPALVRFAVGMELLDGGGGALVPPVRPTNGERVDLVLPSFRYRVAAWSDASGSFRASASPASESRAATPAGT
jgi:hypothetical protein